MGGAAGLKSLEISVSASDPSRGLVLESYFSRCGARSEWHEAEVLKVSLATKPVADGCEKIGLRVDRVEVDAEVARAFTQTRRKFPQ